MKKKVRNYISNFDEFGDDEKKLISKIVEATSSKEEKIDRSAFLYLDPKKPKGQFAQCGTCFMWTGKKGNTCFIHGTKIEVTADMSCGFYVNGKPTEEFIGKEQAIVKPQESGAVKRKVRCENCKSFNSDKNECELFKILNEKMGDLFSLDVKVDAQGCCNAQTPK